jgi:hypothetical protein
MAEVALTFDNAEGALDVDASEVQITRRAYRAGESEFFINRQQVRLRDIVDLLMGTGLGPGLLCDRLARSDRRDPLGQARPTGAASSKRRPASTSSSRARPSRCAASSDRNKRHSHQRPVARDPSAHSGTRDAGAARAALPQSVGAAARPRDPVVFARERVAPRGTRVVAPPNSNASTSSRWAPRPKAATVDAEPRALRGTDLLEREGALDGLRAETTRARAELAELEVNRPPDGARREALEAQSSQITGDRERAEAERDELRAGSRRSKPRSRRARRSSNANASARNSRRRPWRRRGRRSTASSALREVEAAAAADAASEAERRAQLQATHAEYERARARGVRATRGRRAQERTRRRTGARRRVRPRRPGVAGSAGRRRTRGRGRGRRTRRGRGAGAGRRPIAPIARRRASWRVPRRACTRSRNSKRTSRVTCPARARARSAHPRRTRPASTASSPT